MSFKTKSSRNHVNLGENGLLGIPQGLIPTYLNRFDPKKSLPKKVHELLIGYMRVQFFNEELRESAIIGFPVADSWQKYCSVDMPAIEWLMENQQNLIKDTDTDIQVSSAGLTFKYQVTRFVYPQGKEAHRKLSKLIAKKCKMQQEDRTLSLVVSIERTPRLTECEIKNLLTSTKIPFGEITLIMKASEERGHITIWKIYPKVSKGVELKLPLPI